MWKEIKPGVKVKSARVTVYTPSSNIEITYRTMASSLMHTAAGATHYMELSPPMDNGEIELILGALTERLRAHDSKLRGFSANKTNSKPVKAILAQGYNVTDCLHVINIKAKEWLGTEQQKYFRPITLFRPSLFEGYLNQTEQKQQSFSDKARELQGALVPEEDVLEGEFFYAQRRLK